MLSAVEILLFAAIGGIVSLDVAGLTAVKPETYLGSDRDVVRWSLRNGFWHAFMLLVYGLLAVGLFDFAIPAFLRELIAWLQEVEAPQWMLALAIETRGHFPVFFAIATIAIVWDAYRRKICENPLAEDADQELEWQRRWLRGLMLRLRLPAAFVKTQLQSVAVAMDMLALAFLLKSLNLFRMDWTRVLSISVVILVAVTAVTWVTAKVFRGQFTALIEGKGASTERRKAIRQVLISIRLTEPLLIFYFISELVSYLIWHRMASSSLFFLGSALLVFSLVKCVGFRRISDVVDAMIAGLLERKVAAGV
jgi:hypothetical protein